MLFRKILLTLVALSPGLVLAGNTMQIQGQVASSTCDVTVNGSTGNVTVLLPTVTVADFAAPNSAAGETSFSLEASNCSTPDSALEVRFIANRVRPGATSMLNMEGPGYATGIDVVMTHTSGGVIQLPQIGPGTMESSITMQGPPGARYGSRQYYVKYFRWGSPVITPGKVFTSAQYAILYP